MSNEERLVDIEIKLSRQEDLVESLNQMVYQQQKKMGELEALCAAMARHVKDMRDAASEPNSTHERPPHY